jgi:hypothetical protein
MRLALRRPDTLPWLPGVLMAAWVQPGRESPVLGTVMVMPLTVCRQAGRSRQVEGELVSRGCAADARAGPSCGRANRVNAGVLWSAGVEAVRLQERQGRANRVARQPGCRSKRSQACGRCAGHRLIYRCATPCEGWAGRNLNRYGLHNVPMRMHSFLKVMGRLTWATASPNSSMPPRLTETM